MENGGVIVENNKVFNPILKDGFDLVGAGESFILGSNLQGSLILISREEGELLRLNIKEKVLSGAYNDRNLLAVLTIKNQILLIDIEKKRVVFRHKEKPALTSTSDIASPYFYQSIVLFPTLNGKLLLVDTKKKKIAREVIVSSEKFFSNVSHLSVFKDRLIIASSQKAVSIGESSFNEYKGDIRLLGQDAKNLYMLTLDGTIVHLDRDLNEIKSKKFPFARFVGISVGESITLLESSGYLFSMAKDLEEYKIYELSDNFDDYFFLDRERLYYGRKILRFSDRIH